MASAADGPGHAGEDRRHLGRRDYRRIRNGGADWGSERLVRRGRDRYVPGGPIAPVCGLRAALRFFGEPVGTAAGQPEASVCRSIHGGAGILYADGGPVPVGGPGVCHAGICAGGSAVQAGQRWADQSGCGTAGDFIGEPLCRRKHQPAAELCGHAGTGVAVA